MYLSRVPLNPARRGSRRFLSSPHVLHGAVMKSFPPGVLDHPDAEGRVLWRIDKTANDIHLYVVSPVEPDFTHVIEQVGWPTTGAWTTRKYGQLLDNLADGQRWHFRLTANPARSTFIPPEQRIVDDGAGTKTQRGKVAGLNQEEQLEWLRRKAIGAGFAVTAAGPAHQREDDVRIISRETLTFDRADRKVVLSVATFEGVLTITDPGLLRNALINGIGRAKGYGCGLLTLAPNR
ncbi:type I-E CRISPR-associated protein Cas6/Cse3/CasE [Nocardia uniformis]|uniref:Type I-E CRISPR-associated protein Cas6/Cse3/CasE n=1 Tax=Nocardia uniformis TaxID=53432 RepID=A0A849C7E2_9NOCA|nr:type I-E CRISPR-associated protein Cas6/Cse3/CasE [Nocardia uniformis]NNH72320.1 type I-E CRISPR-associated protein Cas6/Cse3/CasE [Nocardia uniformis]